MTTNHTPGPWKIAHTHTKEIIAKSIIVARAQRPRHVSEFAPSTDAEFEANTCLIAAAPELLEALRAATNDVLLAMETAKARGDLSVFMELRSHVSIYQSIIAKAEGRES